MASLGEALPQEITRVREIAAEYRALPGGSGVIAAILMERDLDEASKVIIEGDLAGMIAVYQKLQKWER